MSYTSNDPGPRSKLGPHSPEEIPEVVIHMIEEIDVSVGRIMAALDKHDLNNNTFVFFTSDNGGLRGYGDAYSYGVSNNGPLRGQKGQVYEGGHRVPAIAWWPDKLDGGKTTQELTMTMDLAPTILELLELEPVRPMDGISMSPILLEDKSLNPRTLFWRHRGGTPSEQKAVRREHWKLVVPSGENSNLPSAGGAPELYNLKLDLSEKKDISKKHPEIVSDLLKELDAWEKDVSN